MKNSYRRTIASLLTWIFILSIASSISISSNVNATHDPNDFFTLEANFPGIIWNDIHGTTSLNVFAVGLQGTTPAVARRTSTGWALQTFPSISLTELPDQALNQVWVGSSNVAYATFNGVWQPDVSLTSVNPRYAYYENGWQLRTVVLSEFDDDIVDQFAPKYVWGQTLQSVFIAFEHSQTTSPIKNFGMWKINNGIFSNTVCERPFGVTSVGRLTAMGPDQLLDIDHQSSWTYLTSSPGPAQYINDAQCSSSGLSSPIEIDINDQWNEWIILDDGGIRTLQNNQFTGVLTQTIKPSPTMQPLNAIWGLSNTYIWAVGDGGTIIHKGSGEFTTEPSITTNDLTGVYCSDEANCWITSDNGEIFSLLVIPTIPNPSLTGLQWDPNDLWVHTSEAQCLGDEVSLGINVEPQVQSGTPNVYILNSDTGLVMLTLNAGNMFSLNNKAFHTSVILPTGEYQFLVTADVIGLLTPDNWAMEAFSIPIGTCKDSNQDGTNQRLNVIEGNLTSISQRLETNLTQILNNLSNLVENIDILVNVTVNETLLSILLAQTQAPIANSLDVFFWIVLVAASAIFLRMRNSPVFTWVSVLFALMSMFWGLSEFDGGLFKLLVVSIAIVLWSMAGDKYISNKG